MDVRKVRRRRHQRPSTLARRPSRSYDSAPASSSARFCCSFSARDLGAAEAPRRCATGRSTAAPSASSTTPSPVADVHDPDCTGAPIVPGVGLRGAADPDPARPDRQAQSPQAPPRLGRRRRRAVPPRRDAAPASRAAHRRAPPARLRHRQDEDVAGLDLGHDGVDHQVVVLAAAHGPRRTGGAEPGDDLHEGGSTRPVAAGRLVGRLPSRARELVP